MTTLLYWRRRVKPAGDQKTTLNPKTCQSRQFVVRKRAVDEKLQIVGTDTFTFMLGLTRS